MTPKERRLVFVYSKMCDLDDTLNHCIGLLRFNGIDEEEIEDDDKIAEIRNGLFKVEEKLESLKENLEHIVNENTNYKTIDL